MAADSPAPRPPPCADCERELKTRRAADSALTTGEASDCSGDRRDLCQLQLMLILWVAAASKLVRIGDVRRIGLEDGRNEVSDP